MVPTKMGLAMTSLLTNGPLDLPLKLLDTVSDAQTSCGEDCLGSTMISPSLGGVNKQVVCGMARHGGWLARKGDTGTMVHSTGAKTRKGE